MDQRATVFSVSNRRLINEHAYNIRLSRRLVLPDLSPLKPIPLRAWYFLIFPDPYSFNTTPGGGKLMYERVAYLSLLIHIPYYIEPIVRISVTRAYDMLVVALPLLAVVVTGITSTRVAVQGRGPLVITVCTTRVAGVTVNLSEGNVVIGRGMVATLLTVPRMTSAVTWFTTTCSMGQDC